MGHWRQALRVMAEVPYSPPSIRPHQYCVRYHHCKLLLTQTHCRHRDELCPLNYELKQILPHRLFHHVFIIEKKESNSEN